VKVKVKDVPPGRLLLVEPQTTVAEVARLMRVDDCDAVAVMSKGRLVGIVTEKDLVQAIADGVDPQQAKADLIMSADPATVGPDEDVAVVAVKMTRLGIRHLPVVTEDGEPVGLLSARDLLAVLEKGGA
jgi:CBS domain-containing protein